MPDHDHDHSDDCPCCHGDDEGLAPPTPEQVFGPEIPSAPVPLRAGPVHVDFDPDWGFLRRFRVGDVEILRAVYMGVRAANWATVRPVFRDVKIDAKSDRFTIALEADCRDEAAGIDLTWHGEMEGTPDGTIRYAFSATPKATLKTNRTGLCVLHPHELAGSPLSLEHPDGSVTRGHFPKLISPHQPFFGVRAITHQPAPNMLVKVTCDGETFEMEDQRNWTDASFKTYGGPLSIPLPRVYQAGERLRQEVKIELLGDAPPVSIADDRVVLTLPEESDAVALPSVGLRWAPDAGELGEEAIEQLQAMAPGHLLIDVDVTRTDWRVTLGRALAEAETLGIDRFLLFVSYTPNYQPALSELAADLVSLAENIIAICLRNPDEPCPGGVTLELARAIFSRVLPGVPLAAAPLTNFADMNRFRPPAEFGTCVPLCPQVHTFDVDSMMENIAPQIDVLRTVRGFSPDQPIHAAPIALKRRRQPDARQGSLFCGAWTVGSLATLVPSGLAASLTYHEHAGVNGVLGTPTAEVIEALAAIDRVAAVKSSAPGRVTALMLYPASDADDEESDRYLLLANLCRHDVTVVFEGEDSEVALEPYGFGCFAI